MRAKTLVLAFSVLACGLTTCATGADGVLRVSDGKTIPFARMIGEVEKADIIFVGEIHDSPEHHRLELEIVRALHEAGAPLAVGLEMFRTDSQKTLDAWVKGAISLDQFLPAYYDNWRRPWPLYRDILFYAREHRIPLIGLNIPDKIAEAVARDGFAALTEQQKKQLPPGISCNVDPTYMDFIRRAYAGHVRDKDRSFLSFCEAQMVWDKTMAWHIVRFKDKHPGKTVVVLAGVGHAWRRGIPEQAARESKYTSLVILPLVPDRADRGTVTLKDADYVVLP